MCSLHFSRPLCTASTAAFQVTNASVTIQNITIVSTNAVTYGVLASSAYITLSSVSVQDPGGVPDKTAASEKILALLKDQLK